jgi:small subunit ribosomal protein S6
LLCTLDAGPLSPGGGESRMLRKYELIFIIDAALEEEEIKALVEKFKNMIETSAQFESIDEWGRRKLAYPINYKTEGYYVLINFSADPEFPRELERVLRITDGIIKSMIVNKEN